MALPQVIVLSWPGQNLKHALAAQLAATCLSGEQGT